MLKRVRGTQRPCLIPICRNVLKSTLSIHLSISQRRLQGKPTHHHKNKQCKGNVTLRCNLSPLQALGGLESACLAATRTSTARLDQDVAVCSWIFFFFFGVGHLSQRISFEKNRINAGDLEANVHKRYFYKENEKFIEIMSGYSSTDPPDVNDRQR